MNVFGKSHVLVLTALLLLITACAQPPVEPGQPRATATGTMNASYRGATFPPLPYNVTYHDNNMVSYTMTVLAFPPINRSIQRAPKQNGDTLIISLSSQNIRKRNVIIPTQINGTHRVNQRPTRLHFDDAQGLHENTSIPLTWTNTSQR